MGGDGADFPSTSLGLILGAREPREDLYRAHLDRLVSDYWKPVYVYIRRTRSKSDADAKDLTQDFFLSFLDYDAFRRFDPQLGNFRTYLKGCLRNFLNAETMRESRLKRGGGRKAVSLDAWLDGAPRDLPDATLPPDEEFDQEWSRAVLNESIRGLERRLGRRGKPLYFGVFRRCTLTAGERPSYRAVAQELGVTESDVRNYLHVARLELRSIVEEKIGEYVLDRDEMRRELARILGES